MEGRERIGSLSPPHVPSSSPQPIQGANPKADAVEDELLPKVGVGRDDRLAATLSHPIHRTQPVVQPKYDVCVCAQFEPAKLDSRSKHPGTVVRDHLQISLVCIS